LSIFTHAECGLKPNKIVTISIGFQGFDQGIDFDETAGNNNQQRRDFVDKNRNFYGMFNVNKGTIQPAYIAMPNPMYGNWETGMYNPKVFNKQTAFDMTPAERNQQRRESLNRWEGK
jgi:predicted secreted acid phosphatase